MRVSIPTFLLVLFAPSLLAQAQGLADSWNTRFPVPGLSQGINAVAVEGEAIAVMTSRNIRIYRDGRWGTPIALPNRRLRSFSYDPPARLFALYNGQPWIAADTVIFRFVDGSWEEIAYPVSGRHKAESSELAVVAGELFVAPDLHRWTGDGWEDMLPDSVRSVEEAIVSASGERWLLRNVHAFNTRMLENGELTVMDAPDSPPGEIRALGIAFAGEDPVVDGFLYRDGVWVKLSYPDGFELPGESIATYPIVGGDVLYAISPVWDMTTVTSPSGNAWGVPCSNHLFRLEDTVWRAVSGPFDRPARAVASWGDGGAIVGGAFLSDGVNFVSDDVVGFDGSEWELPGTPAGLPWTGAAGIIEDVALQGDSLWIAGERLYANGLPGNSPVLVYADHVWHRIEGISGIATHIGVVRDDVYVAGEIVLDDTRTNLVRLRDGEWEEVAAIEGTIVELKVEDTTLYVGVNVTATPHSTSFESLVYRIEEEKVEAITPRWKERMNTFAIAGEVIYLGGRGPNRWYSWDVSPAPFARVVENQLEQLAGPRGFTSVLRDELPYVKYISPSINALHWHDGRLYVGGEFDSVADLAVRSIARFNGEAWEALDRGVVRDNAYQESETEGCGPFAFEGIYSIDVVNDLLVVAGQFSRIGALRNDTAADAAGTAVSFPLGTYNLLSGGWTPGVPERTDSTDAPQRVNAIDIRDGRLAIVGDFTLPGTPDSPTSRNVAVAGRTLSVEGEIRVLRIDLR